MNFNQIKNITIPYTIYHLETENLIFNIDRSTYQLHTNLEQMVGQILRNETVEFLDWQLHEATCNGVQHTWLLDEMGRPEVVAELDGAHTSVRAKEPWIERQEIRLASISRLIKMSKNEVKYLITVASS